MDAIPGFGERNNRENIVIDERRITELSPVKMSKNLCNVIYAGIRIRIHTEREKRYRVSLVIGETRKSARCLREVPVKFHLSRFVFRCRSKGDCRPIGQKRRCKRAVRVLVEREE